MVIEVLKKGISSDDVMMQFIRFLKEYGVYTSYKRKFYMTALKMKNTYLDFACFGNRDEIIKMCERFFSFKSQFKSTFIDYYVMFVVRNTYKTDAELGYWKFISDRWVDYAHKNLMSNIEIF